MSAPTSNRSFWTRAQPVRVGHVGDRQREADLRVELVDRAVGLDPRVRLGHPAHVAEVGLAVVAEAGVDAGEIHGHAARRTVTSRPTRVGGSGKPVRDRRGPATVTGDAERERLRAAATGPPRAAGKARIGRARKPGDLPPTTKPDALVERGGSSSCSSDLPAWRPVLRCSSLAPAALGGERDRAGGGDAGHAAAAHGDDDRRGRSPRTATCRTRARGRARAARSEAATAATGGRWASFGDYEIRPSASGTRSTRATRRARTGRSG